MRGCLFNIIVFILSGSVLCGKHSAAMYFGKITIREFISSFGIFIFICADSQIPLPILLKTILFNILVLFLCRRLMLAPHIFLIKYIASFFYQSFRMLKCTFIQYYCHMFTSFHSIPGLYSSFIHSAILYYIMMTMLLRLLYCHFHLSALPSLRLIASSLDH